MKTGSSRSRSAGGRGTATGWRPSFVCEEWARSEWAPWSQSPAHCPHHPHWWPATRKRMCQLKKYIHKNFSLYECDGMWCFDITQVVHLVLSNWELQTLNLVRWLSRMGSLYRQLQQLPIASAGQLKPVRDPNTNHRISDWASCVKNERGVMSMAEADFLLSAGHRWKGICVSIPGSSTGHCRNKPVGSLDWSLQHYSLPPESITEMCDMRSDRSKLKQVK